jgi:hypothetical protein
MLGFVDVANWFCSYWAYGLGGMVLTWLVQIIDARKT